MKYLLDSLQSFEDGHGDALHPVLNGFNDSFMGEHLEVAPATAGEVRELKRSVDERIASMDLVLDRKMDSLVNRITSIVASTHLIGTQEDEHPSTGPKRCDRITGKMSAPYPSRSASVASGTGSEGTSASDSSSLSSKARDSRPVPIPGVTIPNIRAGPDAWKDAIIQWEQGEPARGLTIPLKDWPDAWYKHEMRTFTASKRRERELVVIAYELSAQFSCLYYCANHSLSSCNRDDAAFLAAYPQALKSIRSLLQVLRRDPRISKPRKSKNGTPEHREARQAANAEAESS